MLFFKLKAMSTSKVATKTDLVKLRSRTTSNGKATLYLYYVQFDERVRESIGLSLLAGRGPEIKEKNRVTMAKAEAIRLAKEKELLSETPAKTNEGEKTPFLAYYRNMMEDRKQSDGNYGNWKSCYKYLRVYCNEKTTFADITPRWVQGFKSYLETVEKDTTKMALRPREGFNGLSQNSKCSYFNKLRACLNQAYKEGLIASNPADPEAATFPADRPPEAERQAAEQRDRTGREHLPLRTPTTTKNGMIPRSTHLRKAGRPRRSRQAPSPRRTPHCGQETCR